MAPARHERLLSARDLSAMLAHDVRDGLARFPKRIRPRWSWDARGSELFEAITRLPEY